MMGLLRSELRKVFSLRLWWILILGMLVWLGLLLSISIFTAGMEGLPERDTAEFAQSAWPGAASGTLFALVAGIMLVTSEFQHRTITTTFLLTPARIKVVGAKLVTGAVVGLFYGGVAVAVAALAIGSAILSSGGSLNLVENEVPRALIGSLASYMFYALIGVGLGTLIRSQIAALVVGILWVFLLEPVLVVVPSLQDVGRWLPGGAAAALYDTGLGVGMETMDYLPLWGAVLLLLGYAIAAAAVASATTVRRDVA